MEMLMLEVLAGKSVLCKTVVVMFKATKNNSSLICINVSLYFC